MRKDQSVFVVTLAAFMLVVGSGCGGSGSSKPGPDGGTDLPGAGGVFGSGGSGPGGRGGTGGTAVGTDGGGAGADGSGTDVPGTGSDAVAGGDVPKADAITGDGATADVPVSTDAVAGAADAPRADTGPDVIIAIDGGPTVVVCPADVATAACTTGDVCLRTGGEACGCLANSRWFCPGLIVGTDGGVMVTDASTDLPALGTCGAGVAADQPCTTLGAVCSQPGSLGCACFGFGGNLRWLCGP